jgi:hypothetical protein
VSFVNEFWLLEGRSLHTLEITANDPAAENMNAVVRRAAGDSMEEIDRVIRER